jgi:hypothetical protein
MRSDVPVCPSARCAKGAMLIGIVQADGSVGYLGKALPVNDEFIQITSLGRTPEKRFRFSDECATSRCKQWVEQRCGVIDNVIALAPSHPCSLPHCSIRSSCRWFLQAGSAACSVCPLVITNLEITG